MKQVFFISTMLLGSFILKAQQVQLGLKGGFNVATIHGSTSSYDFNYDPRISMHVGGLAHIHLTKEFAIQPEIVFSAQGFKAGDEVYRLNYLNFPVLVQYMFQSGFRVETGPQVGVLLSANLKNGSPKNIKSNYNDVDMAWAFGAGYVFTNGFGFDARVNAGIPKINDNNLPDKRNGVFQVGVFYQFSALKHK